MQHLGLIAKILFPVCPLLYVPGACIRYTNNKILENVSMMECIEACISETTFVCASVDYDAAPYNRCHMSDARMNHVNFMNPCYTRVE